ncbi:MAG: DUF1659 domain-containing protein [Eubacteriaceae bacterium]|jgi:hypothetical protein|nr:DUF1659 domain-containing protein [Eubacteriaceae bacterium]
MAITSNVTDVSLKVANNYGMVDGKEVVKSKSYNQMALDATDEAMMATAKAIDEITEPTMDGVNVVTTRALTEA